MPTRRGKTSLFALLFVFVAAAASAQTLDCRAVEGWYPSGPPRAYNPENLFNYKVVRMNGVTCVRASGEDSISIDIYEMSNYEMAYGMFAATLDPRGVVERIGMAGQVLPQRATFSKDRFFVELVAHSDKDYSATLRAFATAIEKSIPGRSDPPSTVSWFPMGDLEPQPVRLKGIP